MKKFSFKKLATVSLFFTSIIFTSAFTTCFVPTISTSHSNNDITAVDLSQYDGQYLPGAEDLDKKPSDRVILRCLVTAG
jgi:hypothetical protein